MTKARTTSSVETDESTAQVSTNEQRKPFTRREKLSLGLGIVVGSTFGLISHLGFEQQTESSFNIAEARASIAPCYAQYTDEERTVTSFPKECDPIAAYVPYSSVIPHPQKYDRTNPLYNSASSYILPPKSELPTEQVVLDEYIQDAQKDRRRNTQLNRLTAVALGLTSTAVALLASVTYTEITDRREKKKLKAKETAS